MSIEAENIDNESTVNELLEAILIELKINNLYLSEISNDIITQEDIEE